jgi:hypothetical protein
MRAVQRWWPAVLAAAIVVFAFNGRFWAADEDDKKQDKELDKKIGAVTKTVVDRGASMYNDYRDYAGCYRFYQGSLVTLRPLLDGHPDLQKAVDKALADANRAGSVYQRALLLNGALQKIHKKFKPLLPAPAKDKKDKVETDKGPDDKAPRDDSKKDKKDKDKGKKDNDSGSKDKDNGSKDKTDKDSKKDKDDEAKNQPVRDKEIPKDLFSGLKKQ